MSAPLGGEELPEAWVAEVSIVSNVNPGLLNPPLIVTNCDFNPGLTLNCVFSGSSFHSFVEANDPMKTEHFE